MVLSRGRCRLARSTRATSAPPTTAANTEQGALPPDSRFGKGSGARSSSAPSNTGYDRDSAAAADQPFNVFGDFSSSTRNVEPMRASRDLIPPFHAPIAIGTLESIRTLNCRHGGKVLINDFTQRYEGTKRLKKPESIERFLENRFAADETMLHLQPPKLIEERYSQDNRPSLMIYEFAMLPFQLPRVSKTKSTMETLQQTGEKDGKVLPWSRSSTAL